MTEAESLLAQLRDIHEPIAPSGLPVSLWWLTLLLAATLLLCAFFIRRSTSNKKYSTTWLQHQVELASQETADQARLRMARLLRQHTIEKCKNGNIHLTGDEWLKQLNRQFNTQWFTEGEGKQFGDNLYHSSNEPITRSACEHIIELIERRQKT